MNSGLQAEIKQAQPFSSLAQEAFLNLLRTAAILEQSFAEGIRAYDVTPTQYNALRILRGAGPQGLSRNEVRDRMIRPVPDATRLLNRLEGRGLIERTRDSADKRYVTARITASGRELLERMEAIVADLHEQQLRHLSEPELRRLTNLLAKARAARV